MEHYSYYLKRLRNKYPQNILNKMYSRDKNKHNESLIIFHGFDSD
jgi:hypothetical protein